MVFPDSIYEQREVENLPGLVYDPDNKKSLYAEDLMGHGDEIHAIETLLGQGVAGDYDTVEERLDAGGGGGGIPFALNGLIPGNMYLAATITNANATTLNTTINQLRFYPHVIFRDINVDRLSIRAQSIGSGSVCRLGIYSNRSDSQWEPADLLVDSGEITLAASIHHHVNVDVDLPAGLYWFAYLGGVANATLSATSVNGMQIFLGTNSFDTSGYSHLQKSFSYAALPGTISTGDYTYGALTAIPRIGFRVGA